MYERLNNVSCKHGGRGGVGIREASRWCLRGSQHHNPNPATSLCNSYASHSQKCVFEKCFKMLLHWNQKGKAKGGLGMSFVHHHHHKKVPCNHRKEKQENLHKKVKTFSSRPISSASSWAGVNKGRGEESDCVLNQFWGAQQSRGVSAGFSS